MEQEKEGEGEEGVGQERGLLQLGKCDIFHSRTYPQLQASNHFPLVLKQQHIYTSLEADHFSKWVAVPPGGGGS